MISKNLFIRNLDAQAYRENFLISAMVSIFAIRIFLQFTGYPHLGNGDFHIAHMLWGGFIMVAAIILLLSFLNKATANIAAVLGGIGFGTFIDELGKFITSDNNYFFQPTIAFIYIIFILLYLISKFIPRYDEVSEKEYLVNTIEMIKESAVNDFDVEEEKKARAYLKECDPAHPIVQALTKLLSRIDATPTPPPNIISRVRLSIRDMYSKVARSGIILKIVISFLAIQTVTVFAQSALLFIQRPTLPFDELGKLYSSLLAGVFVLIGLSSLRFSRLEAYKFFRIAMLITILLTGFFELMRSQWLDLISLSANIFVLLVINYAMLIEQQKNKKLPILS